MMYYWVPVDMIEPTVYPIRRTLFKFTPREFFADPLVAVFGPYNSREEAQRVRLRALAIPEFAPRTDIDVSQKFRLDHALAALWKHFKAFAAELALWGVLAAFVAVWGIGAVTTYRWLFN